jgi:protoheme IX farnesyltransferase
MAETRVIETTDFADGGRVSDYVALLKPRVMSLSIFTALVGMIAAPGTLHPVLAVIALVAIAIGAGASGALNMWYDADIDGRMARTRARPIPQGRVTPEDALAFGTVLSCVAVLVLSLLVDYVAGALLAVTIGFYLFIYTMWLKRSTPQNIVIGGAAGAFPPMIGWAAVTGGVSIESLLLFALIFFWTPPHFWALALYRCRDYERVGVPMLPVVAGADATRLQILVYSLILAPIGVAPAFTSLATPVYGVIATVLGAIFAWYAIQVYRIRDDQRASDKAAKKLFSFSILYLFLLFAIILVEKTVLAILPGVMG